MRLVDSHAHLEEIEPLDAAVADARQAGVVAIIAVGSGYESNQKALELAREYGGFIYAALGLHPWNLTEDIECNLGFIEDNIGQAAAVGEIGLDYHKKVRERADKARQKDVFRRLLEIAARHRKPVSVHSRYAWRDAFELVRDAGVEKAVFHWYTGTASVLRDIIAAGYYLSATPAVDYHAEHRRAVKETPLGRLLLETDSPVVYRRGTEHELDARPRHVAQVMKGVSQLRGIDETEIAEATTANALGLFGIAETE